MSFLYIIGTPIGNLEDITLRALRILGEVDLIACEDTRHTKILLDKYQIKKKLISFHQHSKITKIDYLINELKKGKNIALVTDAGTPGISDPGGYLIEKVLKSLDFARDKQNNPSTSFDITQNRSFGAGNITIVPIPGPSAVATALSICGFPGNSFLFLGFLPKKKGRQTLLKILMKISSAKLYDLMVFYESPYRLLRSLVDMQLVIGNKDIVIARELTKKFEEIFRGKISDAIVHFQKQHPKGEFTIIIKIETDKNVN